MTEKDRTHIRIDNDTHREIDIVHTIKSMTMGDVVREAFKDYKIKHRLEDIIKGIKR